MRFRNTRRILASTLVGAIALQSALISNGLLGVSILSLKKLCTCDHSAGSHDKPPHPEDSHFTNGSNTLQGMNHRSSHQREETPSIPATEMCHSPQGSSNSSSSMSQSTESHNSSEPHFCPHETSKQNVENSALALNSLQIGEEVGKYFPPAIIYSLSIQESLSSLLSGYGNPPFEPPQV